MKAVAVKLCVISTSRRFGKGESTERKPSRVRETKWRDDHWRVSTVHYSLKKWEQWKNSVLRRDFSVHLAAYWFQVIIFLTCFIVVIASIRLNRILASMEHMNASSRRRHSQILRVSLNYSLSESTDENKGTSMVFGPGYDCFECEGSREVWQEENTLKKKQKSAKINIFDSWILYVHILNPALSKRHLWKTFKKFEESSVASDPPFLVRTIGDRL